MVAVFRRLEVRTRREIGSKKYALIKLRRAIL